MTDDVRALEALGNIRRQLNLVATHRLKTHGLHPKQMVMLRFVHRKKQVCLTELARGTATDMAAASRAIGPLIRQGWLKKSRSASDNRAWIIRLTPRARKKMPSLERMYRRLAGLFSESLDQREQEQLCILLFKVTGHLQQTLQS